MRRGSSGCALARADRGKDHNQLTRRQAARTPWVSSGPPPRGGAVSRPARRGSGEMRGQGVGTGRVSRHAQQLPSDELLRLASNPGGAVIQPARRVSR